MALYRKITIPIWLNHFIISRLIIYNVPKSLLKPFTPLAVRTYTIIKPLLQNNRFFIHTI